MLVAVVTATWAPSAAERLVAHEHVPFAPGDRGPQPLPPPAGSAASAMPDAIVYRGLMLPAPGREAAPRENEPVLRPGLPSPEASPSPLAPEPASPRLVAAAPAAGDGIPDPVRTERYEPDALTGGDPPLRYAAAFQPSIAPFKRFDAKDAVDSDFSLRVGDPRLRPVPVGGGPLPGRDLFFGSVMLAASRGSPVPIPSVAPGSRILRYDVTPARRVRFYRDGADNYYAAVDSTGVVRLNYLMDAAATYFGAPIPARVAAEIPVAIRPRLPPIVARVARAVLARLGIAAEATLDRILDRLVAHFRSYGAGATPGVADAADLFSRLATGRVGACRHRAYAFVILLHAVGVPARFVANEAHAFAEAWLPGGGWRRIDLGGVSPALTVFGGEDKVAHRPRHPDPFPRPRSYERAYSLRSGIPEPDPGGRPAVATAVPRSDSSFANDMPPFPAAPTAGVTHVRAQQDVLRGESLVVEGRVERETGRPAAGLRVEVHLTEIGTRQRRQIGVLLSDAKGEFRGSLPIPADLGAGRYDLEIEASGARPSH